MLRIRLVGADVALHASGAVFLPAHHTLLVADHQQQTPYLAQTLGWRERIARAFRHQPLVGVDEVFDCELLPQEIVASEVFVRHGVWVSALVLGFCAREPRGMGA